MWHHVHALVKEESDFPICKYDWLPHEANFESMGFTQHLLQKNQTSIKIITTDSQTRVWNASQRATKGDGEGNAANYYLSRGIWDSYKFSNALQFFTMPQSLPPKVFSILFTRNHFKMEQVLLPIPTVSHSLENVLANNQNQVKDLWTLLYKLCYLKN